MTFPGFAPADLAFLTGLAAHNDRDWFALNRAAYDDRLKPALAALIVATSDACAARGVPLSAIRRRASSASTATPGSPRTSGRYKTHVSAT
jgi:uncharacterized protein (DUF2461 family)